MYEILLFASWRCDGTARTGLETHVDASCGSSVRIHSAHALQVCLAAASPLDSEIRTWYRRPSFCAACGSTLGKSDSADVHESIAPWRCCNVIPEASICIHHYWKRATRHNAIDLF